MTKMLSLFRYIHIHPLLWAVIGLAVATARFQEVMMLLLIVFVHEMGHAWAAARFSWRIKRISLLPFGGVAEMDEHGNRPLKEEAAVILAGPLQHVWLIALSYILYSMSVLDGALFELFFQYNIMILIFNLLPIWPLDGGKLLFLYLSQKKAFPDAHKQALRISLGAALIFAAVMLLAAPLNPNVWIVLGFLLFSLHFEWKQRRFIFMRFLLERYYGNRNEFKVLKPLIVKEDEMVVEVLERFQRGTKHPIIVENDGKEHAALDENELLHAYFSEKLTTARMADLLYAY
ncbi:M50 family metallopeptidase [Bacillus infantis]|uniref:Peptidase M50 domain-containing protein n=1 Tax=Bacillus infantis NRRL B-14911 TaxID=1367477 RepID=U5LE32_9BACI|nr:M50 family metallopeptidase [Bacillus infantis]AGX05680.1 hypothetical protein N288_19010 [Bacillus infantis NRRL B-14911]